MNKILIGALLISNIILGCNLDSTPSKFLNHTVIAPSIYKIHKSALKDSIRLLINDKKSAYYSKEYDSSTDIFIDTILYSPDKSKIAFFVITKYSGNKLLNGNPTNNYFDGHCFIGHIGKQNHINDIAWLRAFNITRYEGFRAASKRIRDIHFKEVKKFGNKNISHNLDDVRFWYDSLWSN